MRNAKEKGKHFYKKSRTKVKRKKTIPVLFLIICIIVVIITNANNMLAYLTAFATSTNEFSIYAEYVVIFNANGGTGTMPNQTISYNEQTPLTANAFTRTDYIFYNWNTEPDGSGTSYSNQQGVTNLIGANYQPVTLYAQWLLGDPVAEINGTFYSTLQDAIEAVPKDDTETTIKLLRNTSEALKIYAGQNIVFNLQNYTVSNNGSTRVIDNYGKIKISNGTVKTSAAQGAINNEANATLIIDGGSITATGSGSRQAIYNNGGTIEISGTAYLSTESNTRAAVQNQSGSTLRITGGTIVASRYYGIQNAGTMTIGTEDGVADKTTPVIQGSTYGIYSTSNFSFFDGIAKGTTKAIYDTSKVRNKEVGYDIAPGEETIRGTLYKTAYLAMTNTVTFNANGGSVDESTRLVENGTAIGTLPIPVRNGYRFDGWFTSADGGTEVTASTVINSDLPVFAHWTLAYVAEINGTKYYTLKAAINDVPTDNTETTITLIRNVTENITVAENKNIVFDFGTYTLTNAVTNNAVVTNNGTIKITNGTINQTAGYAAINNNTTGKVIMTGGNITSTGGKAAIYSVGNGEVEISGNAYLSSNASGTVTAERNNSR